MSDKECELLNPDSDAVMKHIDIYQSIITRMAGNSADCKKWAVALVSAIFIIVAEKGKIEFSPVAFIPIMLFSFLDAYYLSLERFFIDQQQKLVKKVKRGEYSVDDIFVIKPPDTAKPKPEEIDHENSKEETKKKTVQLPPYFWSTFKSFAIWPFYGGMLALVILGVIVALI